MFRFQFPSGDSMTIPFAPKSVLVAVALLMAPDVRAASVAVGTSTGERDSSKRIEDKLAGMDGLLGESMENPNQPNALDAALEGSRSKKSKKDSGGTDAVLSRPVAKTEMTLDVGGASGIRSTESVLRVARNHLGGFRYSYQKKLAKNPNLEGDLTLDFTIAPQGDIAEIAVSSSSTGEASLDQEILDKAHRMKFDKIGNGAVRVTLRLELRRESVSPRP